MPVPSSITDLNVVATSNSPAGTDPIGSSLDDYLRSIQAIVRREQASGASVASASTTNIGSNTDGNYLHVTGTTTITSFGTVAAGVRRTLVFDGVLTLTHNSSSLILPGGSNIVTSAGDVGEFVSEGSGNWRCIRFLAVNSTVGVANVASAATVDLTGVSAKIVHITGTTGINAWTMKTGQVVDLIFDGALTLTYSATTNKLPGIDNVLTVAGDTARIYYDGTTVQFLNYQRFDGTPVQDAQPSAIQYFAQNTAPPGWLKANGAAISRTVYARLFAAIGTTFGAGDGSTTFNIPDLRGEFVRGWDDGRGVDASRAIGSSQTDDFKSHAHPLSGPYGSSGAGAGITSSSGSGGSQTWSSIATAVGGTETRPRNIALLACIKF